MLKKILRLPFTIYTLIINLIGQGARKIPSRLRSFIVNASVLVLLFIGILNYINPRLQAIAHVSGGRLFSTVGLALLMIVLILIAGIDHKISIDEYKFNPAFWLGWFACFIMMFVTSLIHEVRYPYFITGIVSLFIFPMVFIAWADKYKRLVGILARNTVIMSYIFILMNLVITPLTTKDTFLDVYLGVTSNPNLNGIIIIGFYASCLYMLLVERKRSIVYVIPIAFSIIVSYMSNCRTAELAIILETLIGAIYYIKYIKSGERRVSVAKVIAVCLAIGLFAGVFGYVLTALDDMDLNSYAVTLDEAYENLPSDFARKMNTLSSGRVVIWAEYIKNPTLLGNGSPTEQLIEDSPASNWAHNNALDILYASGIIAFVGYILWICTAIWFILKCLFARSDKVGKRGKPGNSSLRIEYLFTILTFLGYFSEAMLERTLFPFLTSAMFLAYMGLIPIAIRRDE